MSSTTRITLALLIVGALTCLMGYGTLIALSNRGVISLAFLYTATPGAIIPQTTPTTDAGGFPPTLPPETGIVQATLPPVATQPVTQPSADPLADIGNQYLGAVQRGDYAAAFGLLDAQTAVIVQTPENLRALMGGLNFNELQRWTFTQQQNLGTSATVIGVVTTRDGQQSDIVLNLTFDGVAWHIQWFNNRL
ncbi:MAG: hypothetical protein U0528_18780 [Anaerolineae bacterium]